MIIDFKGHFNAFWILIAELCNILNENLYHLFHPMNRYSRFFIIVSEVKMKR